jgi:uncharacterized protein
MVTIAGHAVEMDIDRRQFAFVSAGIAAFGGLAYHAVAEEARAKVEAYGPLMPDPLGVLDLPKDFAYTTISRTGDRMSDGFYVPDRADGMGAFDLGGGRVALVRNHENGVHHYAQGAERTDAPALALAYDRDNDGHVIAGGTTTIIYDLKTKRRAAEFLSLAGTIRNCAGGTTPWGSWLSCEEDLTRAGDAVGKDHGWVFEVPARLRGLADPLPLKAMGRFNHEAACVDPRTGIVYLTEDRADGLFYRFLPVAKGQLAKGGRLQALVIDGAPDTRNWDAAPFAPRATRSTR